MFSNFWRQFPHSVQTQKDKRL